MLLQHLSDGQECNSALEVYCGRRFTGLGYDESAINRRALALKLCYTYTNERPPGQKHTADQQ